MVDSATQSMEPVTAFAAIARELTESLDLREVLRRIAARTLALMDAQGVSIIVPRDGMAEFVTHESPPPHSLIPVGFRFKPHPDLVAALEEHRREPLVLRDLHASPMIPAEIKTRINARDLVLVPLRVGDELLGALIIAFNELPSKWPVDPTFLRAVGDQAAVAMRNAGLYEEARRSGEQLAQAEKLSAIGRLVARVAHEINNPLTTARLLTESLEAETLEVSRIEQVRSLARELHRAASVVRDLLLFVHKRHVERRPIALRKTIADIVDGLRRKTDAAGIQVTIDVPDDLPTLAADPTGMRMVVDNLVRNAAHALAGTEGERRITVRARAGGAGIEIEVEDTGPGLSDEVVERLFEPFVTTKPLGEGTGLGLAIVHEIVAAHDGTVQADRAPGGGARFRVSLPLAEPGSGHASPPSPGPAEPGVGSGREAHGDGAATDEAPWGLRVLVIDDEVELQRALRRVLHLLGCEVTSALTGEEGLDHARDGEFDLILCDIRIPGIDGPSIYQRLREEAPDTLDSLVFMTGDTLTEEVRTFLDSTSSITLAKPFGRVHLQEVLRKVAADGSA